MPNEYEKPRFSLVGVFFLYLSICLSPTGDDSDYEACGGEFGGVSRKRCCGGIICLGREEVQRFIFLKNSCCCCWRWVLRGIETIGWGIETNGVGIKTIDGGRDITLPTGFCVHCRLPYEDIAFALFHCRWTPSVWECAGHALPFDTGLFVREFFASMVLCRQDKWEFVLMCCWGIWAERNNIAHGQPRSHCDTIVQGVMASQDLVFMGRNQDEVVLLPVVTCLAYTSSILEAEARVVLWALQTGRTRHIPITKVENNLHLCFY
ncbi:hypothetical protein Tco_1105584 [Tanacetum coccineum]